MTEINTKTKPTEATADTAADYAEPAMPMAAAATTTTITDEATDEAETIASETTATAEEEEEALELTVTAETMGAVNHKKPFKIKDVTRNVRKSLVAASLQEMCPKVAAKFERPNQLPTIHLDSDGTEIDDEEYFRTLDENTELIAVFPGEHWLDPSNYVPPHSEHHYPYYSNTSLEANRIRKLVNRLQENLLNDADLDSLSNMDPNSLVDITGQEVIEQSKDSGRFNCVLREKFSFIDLLTLKFYLKRMKQFYYYLLDRLVELKQKLQRFRKF